MRINSETSLGKIKNLLLLPFSPKAEKEAAKLLAILLKNRPNWESYAEQSLRCFAQNDKSWHRFLDKFEISHRYRHEGAHGLFWAIVNGWDKWLDGWKKETGLGLSFVPLVQDAPPAWILEDFPPSGSLWHWLGAYGPTSLLKSQSLDDLHKQDNFARTPLHWACRYGNIENIKWLVDQGFDLGQEDVLGKVACEYLPQGSKELDEIFNWMEDRRQKNTKALEK